MTGNVPGYARRIGRLPEVFQLLRAHPDGLSVADLAARVGATPAQLREDLLAFFTADVTVLLGLSRPPVLEFVRADGEEDDPLRAEVVRVVDERPGEELGVEYVDAAELALLWTAATALQEVDPDPDLAGAIDGLAETMLGETRPEVPESDDHLATLRRAVAEHRRVRLVYSRAWHAGVTEPVVDPWRLVQTRRGWELDGGVGGAPRTFLLANIRSCELLAQVVEPPADLDTLLRQQRTTQPAQVRLPHQARWAADAYAERVRVLADDEETATLELDLLPPYEQRLGMFLLMAGPDAVVLEPRAGIEAVRNVARELLDHYRG